MRRLLPLVLIAALSGGIDAQSVATGGASVTPHMQVGVGADGSITYTITTPRASWVNFGPASVVLDWSISPSPTPTPGPSPTPPGPEPPPAPTPPPTPTSPVKWVTLVYPASPGDPSIGQVLADLNLVAELAKIGIPANNFRKVPNSADGMSYLASKHIDALMATVPPPCLVLQSADGKVQPAGVALPCPKTAAEILSLVKGLTQ